MLAVTAPLWLAWGFVLVGVAVVRPLVAGPLVCGTIGSAGATLWFVCDGAWMDAAQASLVALAAGALLAGDLRLVERFDDDGRDGGLSPWWWHA